MRKQERCYYACLMQVRIPSTCTSERRGRSVKRCNQCSRTRTSLACSWSWCIQKLSVRPVSRSMELVFWCQHLNSRPFHELVCPGCAKDLGFPLSRRSSNIGKVMIPCRRLSTGHILDCKIICYKRSARNAWLCLQSVGKIRNEYSVVTSVRHCVGSYSSMPPA